MGPMQKYQIYGVFPWAMFIHFLIVIMDSSYLIYLNNANSSFIHQ